MVGPKTATAIVAAIGNGAEFKNGGALLRYPLLERFFAYFGRLILYKYTKFLMLLSHKAKNRSSKAERLTAEALFCVFSMAGKGALR